MQNKPTGTWQKEKKGHAIKSCGCVRVHHSLILGETPRWLRSDKLYEFHFLSGNFSFPSAPSSKLPLIHPPASKVIESRFSCIDSTFACFDYDLPCQYFWQLISSQSMPTKEDGTQNMRLVWEYFRQMSTWRIQQAQYPYPFPPHETTNFSPRFISHRFVSLILLLVLGRTYGTFLHYERSYL